MLTDVFRKSQETNVTEPLSNPNNQSAKYMDIVKTSKSNGAVLSEDVEFKGTLSFSSRMEVNGRFEGEILADGPLVIGDSAIIKANITAQSSVQIRGKVQGNINSKDKVEVASNAQLFGDVRCPKFSLAEGAVFVGKSDTLDGKPGTDFSNIFTRLDKTHNHPPHSGS
jgi:cytoskeletal protein CcmA (bactofilin family)